MSDWKNGVSEIVVSAGVQAENCPQIPRKEKPVKVEKRYRDVTDDDIGEVVSVSDDGVNWKPGFVLNRIDHRLPQPFFCDGEWYKYTRVEVVDQVEPANNPTIQESCEPRFELGDRVILKGPDGGKDWVIIGRGLEDGLWRYSLDSVPNLEFFECHLEPVPSQIAKDLKGVGPDKRYSKVTKDHIGSVVEVRDFDNEDWQKAELIGLAGFGLFSTRWDCGSIRNWFQARVEVTQPSEPPKPQYAKLKICDEVRVIEPTHEFFSAHGQIDDVLGEDQYLFRSDCGLEIGVLHASELKKDESQYGDGWRVATKDDIGQYGYFSNSLTELSAHIQIVAVLPDQVAKRYLSLSSINGVLRWKFCKVLKERYRYCLWQMQHLEEGADIEVLVKKRWIKAKLVTILGEQYARRFVFTTDGSNTQLASQARIRL